MQICRIRLKGEDILKQCLTTTQIPFYTSVYEIYESPDGQQPVAVVTRSQFCFVGTVLPSRLLSVIENAEVIQNDTVQHVIRRLNLDVWELFDKNESRTLFASSIETRGCPSFQHQTSTQNSTPLSMEDFNASKKMSGQPCER